MFALKVDSGFWYKGKGRGKENWTTERASALWTSKPACKGLQTRLKKLGIATYIVSINE